MPAVRKVLKDVLVETAKKSRICHRNRDDHTIKAGDYCLVVRDPGSQGSKNYCRKCAREIIDQAAVDLANVRTQLGI